MTDADVTLRPAAVADAAALADVLAHYVRETVISFRESPPSVEDWSALIRSNQEERLPCLVAELAGEVVGYAYASPWKTYAGYEHTVENSVYIADGFAGKGIGGRLLAALIEACRERGFEQMIAVISRIEDVGDASIQVHRRFGFVDVGTLRRVGTKHGLRIDTHIMQLEL